MALAATIGALGSLGSAGLGVLSANHQSGKAFGRMLYAMQEQARLNYEYGLKSLENSPTSQRKGLESAGYNPMLAVQNATSGANSGWTSQGGLQQDQATDSITNGVHNGSEMAQLAINKQQTDSNVKLNNAQARNATSEAISKEIHNEYLPEREQKELGRIGAETDKLIRETSFFDQLAENMEAERRLQEMGIYFNAGNVRYQADKAYNASTYSADKLEQIAREHQPSGRSLSFRNYTGGIKDVMSGIGSIIHGNQEYYNDTTTETYHDKKSGTTKQYKSTRSGKQKKR